MNEMRILDPSGHTTHGWSEDNEAEVAIARAAFTEATTRGYQAFYVTEEIDGGSKKGHRMESFDPHAEKMMLLPQLRGG